MHVRVLLGHLYVEVLVAEGGGEDDRESLADELLLDAGDLRGLRDGFHKLRFHPERLFQVLAGLIVLVGPPGVTHRAHVDERDLVLALGRARSGQSAHQHKYHNGDRKAKRCSHCSLLLIIRWRLPCTLTQSVRALLSHIPKR